MKRIILLLIIPLLLSNCSSIMKNMIMKRMEKMSDAEKKEMMIKMMSSKSGIPCIDEMEKESGIVPSDSLSIADKASIMLPICFENILLTLDDEQKVQYLTDLTLQLMEKGYGHLPTGNKLKFKKEMIMIIEALE